VSEPYYSQRARSVCVSLSAFFIQSSDPVTTLRFNGHFPGGPGLAGTRMLPYWILLEQRMMEIVVTGAFSRACKAPVKSSPPTNQHTALFYRPVGIPIAQPTVDSTEGKNIVNCRLIFLTNTTIFNQPKHPLSHFSF